MYKQFSKTCGQMTIQAWFKNTYLIVEWNRNTNYIKFERFKTTRTNTIDKTAIYDYTNPKNFNVWGSGICDLVNRIHTRKGEMYLIKEHRTSNLNTKNGMCEFNKVVINHKTVKDNQDLCDFIKKYFNPTLIRRYGV